MSRPRVMLAWSGGKDSAWALHLLQRSGEWEVAVLLTTVNAHFQRVAIHGTRVELLEAQARAAAISLWQVPLPWPCSNAQYEDAMRVAVERAGAEGITYAAFGDLFLEDIRAYREKQLSGTGLAPLFPCWALPTHTLAREMLASGVRATLTCVDTCRLDPSYAGREFDERLLNDLPSTVDPCGENGEFHSFCWDGPMFQRAIPCRYSQTVIRDGVAYADLLGGCEDTNAPAEARAWSEVTAGD